MQVAGPYDLLGAIRRSLPKTLKILGGETIPVEWYLGEELPVTPPHEKGKPLPNPHGIFRILPPVRIRNNVAAEANEPYRLELRTRSEAITFVDGTLDYELEDQDAESITTVTSGPQLIANPNFETYPVSPGAPTGWTASASVTLTKETDDVYESVNSLRVQAGASGGSLVAHQDFVGLTAVEHIVSAVGKVVSGTRAAYLVVINLTDDVVVISKNTTSRSWAQLTGSFVPAAGKTYRVKVGFDSPQDGAVGNVLLYDSVLMTYAVTTYASPADYDLSDRKTISWTGTGALPGDGDEFLVTYKHRMYYPRKVMDSLVTVRATLRCREFTSEAARHYPMSRLAGVLGSSLEMTLRSLSAQRLVRPDSDGDEEYTETVTMGRVLSSGPLFVEESGSMMPWFVDFTVNIAGIYEEEAVQSILELPFEVEIEP